MSLLHVQSSDKGGRALLRGIAKLSFITFSAKVTESFLMQTFFQRGSVLNAVSWGDLTEEDLKNRPVVTMSYEIKENWNTIDRFLRIISCWVIISSAMISNKTQQYFIFLCLNSWYLNKKNFLTLMITCEGSSGG